MTLENLHTPRLRGERLRPDHVDEIRRMHADARVMANLGGVRTEAQNQDYLRRNLDHWDRFGFGLYIVHDVETDAIVGRALLRHLEVDGVDEVELGYALYPEWWRRGLATEIARACMNAGRRQLGLASLVAVTLPENRGSRAVMTKVGMTYERDFTHAGLTHVLYRGA